jgi:hypothetical protein
MKNLKLISSPEVFDNLYVTELEDKNSFDLKRFFFTSGDVQVDYSQGHFHKKGLQILFCVTGEVEFMFYDGSDTYTAQLTKTSKSFLIGSPLWRKYKFLKPNSTFACLCNTHYQDSMTSYLEEDFVRSLNDYK